MWQQSLECNNASWYWWLLFSHLIWPSPIPYRSCNWSLSLCSKSWQVYTLMEVSDFTMKWIRTLPSKTTNSVITSIVKEDCVELAKRTTSSLHIPMTWSAISVTIPTGRGLPANITMYITVAYVPLTAFLVIIVVFHISWFQVLSVPHVTFSSIWLRPIALLQFF